MGLALSQWSLMMALNRTLLVAAVAFTLSLPGALAHAQWTVVGARIYYNAGNVGIGIANPAYPLDVRVTGGRAVAVTNYATTGTTFGVYSVVRSLTGRGMYGLANNTAGSGYGLFGVSNGRSGRGVYGYASNSGSTGSPYGVYGRSLSAKGSAVFGDGARAPGVWGQTASTSAGSSIGRTSAAGVRGEVTSTAPGSWAGGVWGINNARTASGVGVGGYHAGRGYAIYGRVLNSSGYAGYFRGGRNYFEGDVGIGTTRPEFKLDVEGDIKIRTDDRIYFGDIGESGDSVYMTRVNNGANSVVLDIVVGDDPGTANTDYVRILEESGDEAIWFGSDGSAWKPGGGSWTATSDRRVKRDITTLDGSLDRLLQLRGVNFYYTDLTVPGASAGLKTGFVAQEVESVFPEWVTEFNGDPSHPGLKAVTITGFEALTVEALRELQAEKDEQIATLRDENNELRKRLDRVEEMIADLQSK
jgi:endosialidase-like protein